MESAKMFVPDFSFKQERQKSAISALLLTSTHRQKIKPRS